MRKPLAAGLTLLAAAMLAVTACNSDSDNSELELWNSTFSRTSTLVKAFKLQQQDSVLVNLDTVFFSIDLKDARIFNADSLPKGTDVHALKASITFGGAPSKAQVTYKVAGAADSTFDIIAEPDHYINFSNGPVTMRVTSADATIERVYTISVNVHQTLPDSLVWEQVDRSGQLPTGMTDVQTQRTVRRDTGDIYCLTGDADGAWAMAHGADPWNSISWSRATPVWPAGFTPDCRSLTATADALWILSTDGELAACHDADGAEWAVVMQQPRWRSILGGYGDGPVGVTAGDAPRFVSFTNGVEGSVPPDFPVEGTSQAWTFSTQWGTAPQMYITGGRCTDGRLSPDTWAYDGKIWAKVSGQNPLPTGLEGVMMFPYQVTHTDVDTWLTTDYSIMVAMGGRQADGQCHRGVYISYNLGITWQPAPAAMALPEGMPAMWDADAVIAERTLPLQPKATRPITQWECPYIYLFGGRNPQGDTYSTVWRGVINRLTFKPLQ